MKKNILVSSLATLYLERTGALAAWNIAVLIRQDPLVHLNIYKYTLHTLITPVLHHGLISLKQ